MIGLGIHERAALQDARIPPRGSDDLRCIAPPRLIPRPASGSLGFHLLPQLFQAVRSTPIVIGRPLGFRPVRPPRGTVTRYRLRGIVNRRGDQQLGLPFTGRLLAVASDIGWLARMSPVFGSLGRLLAVGVQRTAGDGFAFSAVSRLLTNPFGSGDRLFGFGLELLRQLAQHQLLGSTPGSIDAVTAMLVTI